MKKEFRSASQVLFGFLPGQTVDLEGKVWKVREWRSPIRESKVDQETLRQELLRQVAAWTPPLDGGYPEGLRQGRDVRVYSLDRNNGVTVELFPHVWLCRACNRVRSKLDAACKCGHKGPPGQLHFVGYHDRCGALREPWIPRCNKHHDVRIVFPGTSSASEIVFDCPVCRSVLRKGFGFPACDCGDGRLSFNVHRSSFVYTPRTVVVVNPPSLDKIQRITSAGGAARALSWVLSGMQGRLEDVPASRESLRQQLRDSGLPSEAIDRLVDAAARSGDLVEGGEIDFSEEARAAAEREAITLALAVSEARTTLDDLTTESDPDSERGRLYHGAYPAALRDWGIEAVELIDDFSVLTGVFGYTRGDPAPGASRLVPFRDRDRNYAVYADIAATEALLVRLDPSAVTRWLKIQGFDLELALEPELMRAQILEHARIPDRGAPGNAMGAALLTLVHSIAHRMIRLGAVHAGIEQNALSEVLVPLHLGFIVYAAARGDFVLGGLQAVYETDLHHLLRAVAEDNRRCPLDPGCLHSGGACMACLHVGEPSCRLYNGDLSRAALFGERGYFSARVLAGESHSGSPAGL